MRNLNITHKFLHHQKKKRKRKEGDIKWCKLKRTTTHNK
ncbi:Protein CBG27661 [Caenorhabditis briggsae]|uniref:Protein CBG27661 n=1 Tax=Caenorhabditis briggsae TaxID=6238 RepID=B6IJA6_CAEBR|nr:Protein CBG27661 [Caenorhabditis briggsae]CAR99940.1 Protein CBG27661 [Caenorhabditis briggsae]